ncbi:MAG: CDP-alcohol phosphatidyltransferase family protein [Candidatus Yanofskybacteria bacterium]|nr:CDP-alcohol phosphatidyltransferase family protein [Candidatus Yanofskybacteria bacterium]
MIKIKKYIPNAISSARLISAIPAAIYFWLGANNLFLGFIIFQAVGDRLDGYLARRWNGASPKGKMLDTVADLTFFIGVYFVMFLKPGSISFALLYLPGVIWGTVVLTKRMIVEKKLFFPRRPIDHVSYILYFVLVSLLYWPFAVTFTLAVAGAVLILISSYMLMRNNLLNIYSSGDIIKKWLTVAKNRNLIRIMPK